MNMRFSEDTENTKKSIEKNEKGETVITRQADTIYYVAKANGELVDIHTVTKFYTITYDEEPSQEEIDRNMETVIYNMFIDNKKHPYLKKYLKDNDPHQMFEAKLNQHIYG